MWMYLDYGEEPLPICLNFWIGLVFRFVSLQEIILGDPQSIDNVVISAHIFSEIIQFSLHIYPCKLGIWYAKWTALVFPNSDKDVSNRRM